MLHPTSHSRTSAPARSLPRLCWVLVAAGLAATACGSDGPGASGQAADTTVTDTAAPDTTQTDTGAPDTTPADTTPADTTPADTTPADTTPVDPCAVAGTPCNDGDPCTMGDVCVDGSCQGGPSVCDCASDADCDDGDACNGSDYCDKAKFPYACKAKPGSAVVCDQSDANACAEPTCNPSTGACAPVAKPDKTPCADGDPCTLEDACKGGVCVGSSQGPCKCAQDSDCAAFDDGNVCTGTLYCDKSDWPPSCKVNPATVVQCDGTGDTACSKNACDSKDGACKPFPVEQTLENCVPGKGCSWIQAPVAGKPPLCDDGDACTAGDVCDKGSCKPGPNDLCKCSKDSDCDGQEDGDLCNGTLYCDLQSGKCQLNPATVIQCPTGQDTACSANLCVPSTGQCVYGPLKNGKACDDGDACTGGDICLGGSCVGPTNTCPCKVDADCKSNDDGNLCNGTRYCDGQDGTCKDNLAKAVVCPSVDDTACSKNACVPLSGSCTETAVERTTVICDLPATSSDGKPGCRRERLPDAAPDAGAFACNDGDACTTGDLCAKGSCGAGTYTCYCKSDADCQDDGDLCNGKPFCDKSDPNKPVCKNNPSTIVTCPTAGDTACIQTICLPQTGNCKKALVDDGSDCDDGVACTSGDFCLLGGCKGGKLVCPCLQDADCKDVDGDFCNGVPYCDLSDPSKPVCKPNPASVVYCAKGDDSACLKNQCDSKSGLCSLKPTKDGSPCDDGTICTGPDGCSGGDCVGKALDCDDKKLCTLDACDPKVGCTHSAKNCDDGNLCTADFCDAKDGGCVHDKGTTDGKPCNADDSACTVGDACKQGACVAGPAPTCQLSGNACDQPKCISTGASTFQCVLVAVADGAPCADGKACKIGASCQGGKCLGGGDDTLYFKTLADSAGPTVASALATTATGALLAGTRKAKDGTFEWLIWRVGATGKLETGWPKVVLTGLDEGEVVYASAGATIELLGYEKIGTARKLRYLVVSADGKSVLANTAPAIVSSVRSAVADGVGGFYATGSVEPDATGWRVASTGQLGWATTAKPLAEGFGIAARAKGGAVVVGRVYSGSTSAEGAAFVSNSGQIEASYTGEVGSTAQVARQLQAVDALADGGALAAGWRLDGGAKLLRLVALDAAAKERWALTSSTPLDPRAIAPRGTGWILGGVAPGSLGTDASIVAVDAAGAVLFTKAQSGVGADGVLAFDVADGGNVLATGYASASAGATVGEAFSWRLSAYGQDSCDSAGACYGKTPADCDDKDVCTNDACTGGSGCSHTFNSAVCDDGDACTLGDTCIAGSCKSGTKPDCDDKNPCTEDTCDAKTGCVHKDVADLTPCDNGKACLGGVCASRWAVTLDRGDTVGCSIGTDGLAKCWGYCYSAPCGFNTVQKPAGTAVTVAKIKNVKALRVADSHACAIDGDQITWCWGFNSNGKLGVPGAGVEIFPVVVVGAANSVAIDVGLLMTCSVDSAGDVYCWGSNYYSGAGQPGNADVKDPTKVANMPGKAKAVTAGLYGACALLTDGTVACWGTNANGELGIGATTPAFSTAPKLVKDLTDVVSLDRGELSTCAVKKDGTVWCWGHNGYGQLGDGSKANRSAPAQVFNIKTAKSVSVASRRACAVLADGKVRCWGDNYYGELGTGDTFQSSVPLEVVGLDKVEAVAAGTWSTCAMKVTGEVMCWGRNVYGSLGTNSTASQALTPESVYGSAPQ